MLIIKLEPKHFESKVFPFYSINMMVYFQTNYKKDKLVLAAAKFLKILAKVNKFNLSYAPYINFY